MRMRMRTPQAIRSWRLGVTLALSAPVWTPACLREACTDAGCTSGISVKVVGIFPVAPARARACLDELCAEVPWPAGASSCEAVEAVEADWRLSVCLQDDGSLIQAVFAEDTRVGDGMKFELIVEDGDGEALLHESERVTFSDSYPNGKRCPGNCKYANYRY